MTKEQILAQATYQEAIKDFHSKSMDFDLAAKAYRENKNTAKEQELMQASKSAWALYCYQMGHLLYLADHIKDVDATAAAEAAKDLRKIVFDNFQGKYNYLFIKNNPTP